MNSFHLKRQLRSMLIIETVSASIGTIYDSITSGEFTLWGPLIGLIIGMPLVIFEVFFPLKFMRKWPFAASVLAKSFLYVGLILLAFLGTAFLYGLLEGLSLRDFSEAMWSSSTAVKVGIASCAFATIIFFMQLNRLLGPGTLVRYIFGRYHQPRKESRIFMFLDLKDSTSIAEQMDVDSYYSLLNDFFHDIAEPVLATKATIYQYVGDEVVLTWPLANGLHDANCVRVFYEIDKAVQRNRDQYLARYGLVPEYKAGVHGGDVISAEIGDLKRDLIYNGDVLNTTARIQSECNRFDARLLVSSALLGQLMLPPGIIAENVGDVILKGKRQPMGLVRLSYNGETHGPKPTS